MEPSKKLLEEEKFTFQRKISNAILDPDVPSALVLVLASGNSFSKLFVAPLETIEQLIF